MRDKMEGREKKKERLEEMREERREGERWALGRWGSLRCRTGPSGRKRSQVSDGKHWASLSCGKGPGKEIQTPAPHFSYHHPPSARLRQPQKRQPPTTNRPARMLVEKATRLCYWQSHHFLHISFPDCFFFFFFFF